MLIAQGKIVLCWSFIVWPLTGIPLSISTDEWSFNGTCCEYQCQQHVSKYKKSSQRRDCWSFPCCLIFVNTKLGKFYSRASLTRLSFSSSSSFSGVGKKCYGFLSACSQVRHQFALESQRVHIVSARCFLELKSLSSGSFPWFKCWNNDCVETNRRCFVVNRNKHFGWCTQFNCRPVSFLVS